MARQNYRDMDTAELRNELTDSLEQLFRLRFQMKMGQSDGVKKYRELKKDRARMLGLLREREIQSAGKGK